jgi:hypothetical protein
MIVISHEKFVRAVNGGGNLYLADFNGETTKMALYDWNRADFRRNALWLVFKLKK